LTVAFVLHAHLPWVRRNGTYPAGEQWLFEAVSESYLPLLGTLERLAARGARDVLTLGITPILAEQLADPYLLREFHGWLGRRQVDLEYTVSRYGASDRRRLGEVWSHHWRRQSALLALVEDRLLATGLLAPFRDLADAGVIELLGGPATHPCLALMDDSTLLRGQVETGLATWERHLGFRPRGVWTPECAYRPAGSVADPTRPGARSDVELPGLEEFWAAAGVDHLVLDGPTLGGATGRPVWICDSGVAAFGRDLDVSYAVWNPTGGYPTDPAYRDFTAVDLEGGFKSWRVTGLDRPDKQPYEPVAARERALAHAGEFARLVAGRDGLVVAAYDAELFGHWWYEGPLWLEAVVSQVETTTLARALERRPPADRLHLPESSWGAGKGHGAWVGDRTRELWTALRTAEARFAALPAGAPGRAAAWRQLALAQASDWPFLMIRDSCAQYAEERVAAHLARFEQACRGEGLDVLAERDDPWGTPPPSCALGAPG
jgi:1,4-alpha-glucan branching enzyme